MTGDTVYVLMEYGDRDSEPIDVYTDKSDAQRIIDINPHRDFQIIDKVLK
jgi:hypothetical protein